MNARTTLALVLAAPILALAVWQPTTDARRMPLPRCATPQCPDIAPPAVQRAGWRHLRSNATVRLGAARHRGRDLFYTQGSPQWAIAKFAYGPADADLHDEDVDVWLRRGCGPWESLGTARTTNDGQHAAVEGVQDDGGRVYLQIPSNRTLEEGWHTVRFVVKGDGTFTEQRIRVLGRFSAVAVTDVDGTLTENEFAEFPAMLTGTLATTHDGAPEMFRALAQRGYDVMYLTARPEWLLPRTKEWLDSRGFPRGIVHTTLGSTGYIGDAAEAFKSQELSALTSRIGQGPWLGFGNMPSDIRAYRAARIDPSRAFFYRQAVTQGQGVRHDSYRSLIAQMSAQPPRCSTR